MGAAREPDQADFDLERFIEMFDEALTSNDPRVVNALRSLMMIVTLTRPESTEPAIDRNRGPLRRLFEDVNHLNRRLSSTEDELRTLTSQLRRSEYFTKSWDNHNPYDKYTMAAASQMASQIDQDLVKKLLAKQRFEK